jgi:hypothetical protein
MDFDEGAARRWAETLAAYARLQRIQPRGQPYLDRYYVAGWSPWNTSYPVGLVLHHFVASDPDDELHSHPWAWAASVILAGGYTETRCDGAVTTARVFRPGDVNTIRPETRHRVTLLGADCWTLMAMGAYAQPWRFVTHC